MPRSKHHQKKLSDSEWRKRKARLQYAAKKELQREKEEKERREYLFKTRRFRNPFLK